MNTNILKKLDLAERDKNDLLKPVLVASTREMSRMGLFEIQTGEL